MRVKMCHKEENTHILYWIFSIYTYADNITAGVDCVFLKNCKLFWHHVPPMETIRGQSQILGGILQTPARLMPINRDLIYTFYIHLRIMKTQIDIGESDFHLIKSCKGLFWDAHVTGRPTLEQSAQSDWSNVISRGKYYK